MPPSSRKDPVVTSDFGFNGIRPVPPPVNERVLAYAPGSPERAELKARLASMAQVRTHIPLIIGGQEVKSGETAKAVMPHDHAHVLADWQKAGAEHVTQAIEAAVAARREWSRWPWEDRAAVFLKAAELLATTWRATVNAATMLGQSKTAFQAEIDSAAELVDFWRFNPYYAQQLYAEQPLSLSTMWNQLDYRPLEGFVYAVTPFNFTSIAGNLPTAPALMGNTVVWKPASSAIPSAFAIMKLLEAAGLPPGVINFVPGNAAVVSEVVLNHRDLAGVHFTGSTEVFNSMWRTIGSQMDRYRSYPRIVGETGGKDFIVAHASADPQALAVAVVRGGYEYQGQKCSAVSRIYVPRSIWNDVRDRIVSMLGEIQVGDVSDFRNFMGAVIDKKAFDSISGYLAEAKKTANVLAGGGVNGRHRLLHPADAGRDAATPATSCCAKRSSDPWSRPTSTTTTSGRRRWRWSTPTSPYALTGAVFANDRQAVRQAAAALRGAAGNFYVNDKPTGAVVGQQPFGGARASGTNDKAGSKLNLVRWVSARTVKETFSPPKDYRYPFMDEDKRRDPEQDDSRRSDEHSAETPPLPRRRD